MSEDAMTDTTTAAAKTKRRNLTIAKAISDAIAVEMRRDPTVFVMGEDVGLLGSVFENAKGLYEEFGSERVRDTPISEAGFMGAAVGAAAVGMRPIVELMFVDFFGVCMDPIYNLAAKQAYFSGGSVKCPMVVMTSVGGGYSDAGQHSQCLYATFAHLPGLKVVIPSNAYDAKGLMVSAIRDDNPVIFMFHKAIQGLGWLAPVARTITDVPEEGYTVPIGKAVVTLQGKDATIVGWGATVHYALDAAKKLAKEGIAVEVVDLRTISPLDRQTVVDSVAKTGHLVVVDDDYNSFGVAGEVIASAVETDVRALQSSPIRVTYPDIPVPFARPLEQFALPNAEKVAAAVRRQLGKSS
jgi:pyruvate dehydrogenase E1 component beta subunit